MKFSFNVIDASTQDMIADQLPIEDILAVTQFQTSIKCGAVIDSINIVDLDQHIEDDSIFTMIYAEVVVNSETFKVCASLEGDQILKTLLTFSTNPDSKELLMNYVRNCLA